MNSNKSINKAGTFLKGILSKKRTGKMEMMNKASENSFNKFTLITKFIFLVSYQIESLSILYVLIICQKKIRKYKIHLIKYQYFLFIKEHSNVENTLCCWVNILSGIFIVWCININRSKWSNLSLKEKGLLQHDKLSFFRRS